MKTSLLHLLDEQSPANEPSNLPIKPWQRLAALEYTNGTAFDDISKMLGQSYNDVSAFLTSPKGIETVKEVVKVDPDRIANMVTASAVDSVLTLARMRDFGKTESVRVSASVQLLDRAMPKLKAEAGKRKSSQAFAGQSVESEIARLRKELAAGI